MDSETLSSNLSTVKEIVLDEQRLVTYLSLSKELFIHVNEGKALLNKFLEEIRQKDSANTVYVTYVISGITEENKARTIVTPEHSLGDTRKMFKTVFYEHIYSISKGSPDADCVAFLAVSKFDDFAHCLGLITSNSCFKRSSEEIGTLKSKSQASIPSYPKPLNSLPKKVKSEPKAVLPDSEHSESKRVAKVQETKSEPTIKKEITSSPKDQSNDVKSKQDVKKNGSKAQKGIAGFFSKSSSAPAKKPIEVANKKKDKETKLISEKEGYQESKIKEEKTEVVDNIGKTEQIGNGLESKENQLEMKEKEKKDKKNDPKSQVKKIDEDKSKNKSLIQIKKNAKVDKKRKRVLHISDSESDEEKDPFVDESEPMEHESEDEIPPTPTVNTVKITSGIVNPRKRRKIVDKTYTDEDGYVLTKKEEVYESCSDNEEGDAKENTVQQTVQVKAESPKKIKVSPKKNAPKSSKKKISPPQKGKQATMMNFFKKV